MLDQPGESLPKGMTSSLAKLARSGERRRVCVVHIASLAADI